MHGSMTKSGKVRKQTPIVEKKDRRFKVSVGRAKKKRQYQRKFAGLTHNGFERPQTRFQPNKQILV